MPKRDPEEERLVTWAYYLDGAAVHYDRDPSLIDLMTYHGYKNPADVLREISVAVKAERAERFPIPSDWNLHVWEQGTGPNGGEVQICRRCEHIWFRNETERQQGSCVYSDDGDGF